MKHLDSIDVGEKRHRPIIMRTMTKRKPSQQKKKTVNDDDNRGGPTVAVLRDAIRRPNSIPAIAGAVSGLVARLLVSPLDVLKVRMQVQVDVCSTSTQQFAAAAIGSHRTRGYYKTAAHALRRIVHDEGIRGLWKGSVPGILLWAPYNSVQFASLEAMKDACQSMGYDKNSSRVSSVAGTMAGITATVVTFPMDTLRTVLAAQGEPKIYKNVVDGVCGIINKNGLRGLYAGLGATLIEVAPFSAVEFGVYSACRKTSITLPSLYHVRKKSLNFLPCVADASHKQNVSLSQSHSDSELDMESLWTFNLDSTTSGMIAGTLARVSIHPFDVVKKRFQVAGLIRNSRYGPTMRIASNDSIVNIVNRIVEQEGYSGLFKGLTPAIMKAAISSALCFTVYEFVSDRMKKTEVSS